MQITGIWFIWQKLLKKISVSLVPVGCPGSIFVTVLLLYYCDYSSSKISMRKLYTDCFRNALDKNLYPICFFFSSWLIFGLVDVIKKHLDNNYSVCGIFVNLQKAFDTVNRDILLGKLDHYGIRGLANSWLGSFLKNMTQYVYLDGHCSISKQITCGDP